MAFNNQLKELLAKYLQAKAVVPMIPGAGATHALASTALDKIRGMVPPPAPDDGYNHDSGMRPATPEEIAAQPPVQTPPQPPVAPKAPVMPPVNNTPLESAPAAPVRPPVAPTQPQNTAQNVYGSKYDDNARQQLYDALAKKRQEGAGWEAIGSVADMNSRVGGGTPINSAAAIAAKVTGNEKDAKAEFETGRESKLKDVSTNIALQKAGREDTEYKDANDPNSQMSKLAAGFAGQMLGPEKMAKMGWAPGKSTYADVIKVLPIIEKQVALETAKSNKDIMLGTKTDQFRDKQTQTFRDKLNSSQSYKNWQTMSTLNTQAKESLKNPSPYNDLQLVYATVKALDPTSVVREGEIKLFQGTANLKNQLQGALSTAIKGQPLTPEQKQNVVTLIGQLEKTNKSVFMQHEAPTLNQAKRIGLKLNEIDPMLEDQPESSTGTAPAGWKVLR